MGIVLRQVALIALITQPPEFARVVTVIEEELCEGLDTPKGVAGGRERRVVIAVEEDHRDVLDAAAIEPKPISVCRDRSSGSPGSGRERSYRSGVLVWRSGARQSSGAKLQENRDDGCNAKMSGGHDPPIGTHSPSAANSNNFRVKNSETDATGL